VDKFLPGLTFDEKREEDINLGTKGNPQKKIYTFFFFLMTQKTGRNLFDFQPLTASRFSFYLNFHSHLSHKFSTAPPIEKIIKSTAMQRSSDQPVEEEEECSICLDDLRKYGINAYQVS